MSKLQTTGAAHLAVRALLQAIGEDPDREGLVDTPRRVVNAWDEMTSGRLVDPAKVLGRVFTEPSDGIVVVCGIRFASLCEHHILPFTGVCHVGYLPAGDKVVGLSKIPEMVEAFARRLQMQEKMVREIADCMFNVLKPKGVAVVAKAHHACMGCRGVKQPDAEMVTASMRGVFKKEPEVRAEFYRLLDV